MDVAKKEMGGNLNELFMDKVGQEGLNADFADLAKEIHVLEHEKTFKKGSDKTNLQQNEHASHNS